MIIDDIGGISIGSTRAISPEILDERPVVALDEMSIYWVTDIFILDKGLQFIVDSIPLLLNLELFLMHFDGASNFKLDFGEGLVLSSDMGDNAGVWRTKFVISGPGGVVERVLVSNIVIITTVCRWVTELVSSMREAGIDVKLLMESIDLEAT